MRTPYNLLVARTRNLAREHARNAATWLNLDDDSAPGILAGIRDGDPEILDRLPSDPLGDREARRQLAETVGEIDDDLEAEYLDAFHVEIERAVVGECLAFLWAGADAS